MTERCKLDVEILIIKTCKQNKLKIIFIIGVKNTFSKNVTDVDSKLLCNITQVYEMSGGKYYCLYHPLTFSLRAGTILTMMTRYFARFIIFNYNINIPTTL